MKIIIDYKLEAWNETININRRNKYAGANRKKKESDIYFLVWTTTPWTLIANVALCVNPEASYSLVESEGNKFIPAPFSTITRHLFFI